MTLFTRLPGQLRAMSSVIIDAILSRPKISKFDEELRLIVNNRLIPQSNLSNLIHYVLYPYDSRADEPTGYRIFIEALAMIGLEPYEINNKLVAGLLAKSASCYISFEDEDTGDEDYDEEKSFG